MKLLLQRLFHTATETIGILYADAKFKGFILEDIPREVKVKGETRIPAGIYQLGLRKAGKLHEVYSRKPETASFHKGMLELQQVPNFTTIYIHPGNKHEHTKGCPLIAAAVVKIGSEYQVQNSLAAYIDFYPAVAAAIEMGIPCSIEVKDEQSLTS